MSIPGVHNLEGQFHPGGCLKNRSFFFSTTFLVPQTGFNIDTFCAPTCALIWTPIWIRRDDKSDLGNLISVTLFIKLSLTKDGQTFVGPIKYKYKS